MKVDPPMRFVPFAGSAAIALLLVAACAMPAPSPVATATSGPTSRPSPTEVGGPAAGPCTVDDVELAHGPNEGAAGTRFTTMTLTVTGASGCRLWLKPLIILVDASGAELIRGVRAGEPAALEVAAGEAVSSDVRLSDWCEAPPVEPVTLLVDIDGTPIAVEGGPYPDRGTFPDCVGSGHTTFSATDWRRR